MLRKGLSSQVVAKNIIVKVQKCTNLQKFVIQIIIHGKKVLNSLFARF